MNLGKHPWLAVLLAGAAMLAFALLLRTPIHAADAPANVGVLYPPDGSVTQSPLLLVMAIARSSDPQPRLTLDGKPLEVERVTFAPAWAFRDARLSATTRPAESHSPAATALLKDKSDKVLLLASAKLSPGPHVIAAGTSQIKISYAPALDPKTPTLFHLHQPIKDATEAVACDKCHTMTKDDSTRTLGLAMTPRSCQTCHEEVDLQLAHRHVLDSLNKCATCHDAHGSPRPKLLVNTQEILCTQCHESGHSKR